MTHHLAKYIAQFFYSKNIIAEKDIDSYAYGFELILISAINWGVVFVLMLITQTFIETMLYVAVFITLRHHAGGYHADTHLKCFILSLGAYSCLLLLLNVTSPAASAAITLLCLLFSLPTIFVLAPIEHVNHPVSESALKKHRTISLLISGVVTVTATLCILCKFFSLSLVLSLTMLQVSISLLAGSYTNKNKEV